MTPQTGPLISPEMERAAASERVGGRPFEMGMLWSAIGVAVALLLLALLAKAGALSIRAVQICGTILIWLCAAVMLTAVLSAMRYLAKKDARPGQAFPKARGGLSE